MSRHHHHHHHHHHSNDDGLGCLVLMLLGVFAMPLVGVYLMFSGEDDTNMLGLVLLIVGIVLWVMMAG